MRPTGVLIEQHFYVETQEELEPAFLIMSPDNTLGGNFIANVGAMTVGTELKVRVTADDAAKFKESKSDEEKQQIVDRYVGREPGTDRYAIPNGAYLGEFIVHGVLEINLSPKKSR